MKLRVTIPTEAHDITLDQFIDHADKTWVVDKLIHRRSNAVTIALLSVGRLGDDPGKQSQNLNESHIETPRRAARTRYGLEPAIETTGTRGALGQKLQARMMPAESTTNAEVA